MNVQEVFTLAIESGQYREGNFMCNDVETLRMRGKITMSEADDVTVAINRQMQHMSAYVYTVCGYNASVHTTMYSQVAALVRVVLWENAGSPEPFDRSLYKVRNSTEVDACIMRMYKDWSRRNEIVKEFVDSYRVTNVSVKEEKQ
jgi:hypothetical protein